MHYVLISAALLLTFALVKREHTADACQHEDLMQPPWHDDWAQLTWCFGSLVTPCNGNGNVLTRCTCISPHPCRCYDFYIFLDLAMWILAQIKLKSISTIREPLLIYSERFTATTVYLTIWLTKLQHYKQM